MPVYNYTCNTCNHEYSESRLSTQDQWKTACNVPNCAGTYVEVK